MIEAKHTKIVYNSYKKHHHDTHKQREIPKTLEHVKSFIEDNDYDVLNLSSLAAYIGVSKNHLIRIFKKEFGLSPHAYILNYKVHQAKKMLALGCPISEVAVSVGFYDQSHFHKAFKSVFAITPKEFQKMLIFYKTLS